VDEFQILTGGNPTQTNPKLTALNVELLQVEAEIEKLLDTLSGADATLLAYANSKIETLDEKRQSLEHIFYYVIFESDARVYITDVLRSCSKTQHHIVNDTKNNEQH